MTDILDRLTAAIDEADAGTDALCAEYLAEAMASVRDLLDGSNGGYVAPQNRGAASRLVVGPIVDPAAMNALVTFSPAFANFCQELNQSIGRAMQQVAANLQRARAMRQSDFEERS